MQLEAHISLKKRNSAVVFEDSLLPLECDWPDDYASNEAIE